MLEEFVAPVIAGKGLSSCEVLDLLKNYSHFELFSVASRIKEQYSQDCIDLCAIINAKSGSCSEDCSYCAQSSKSSAEISVYPLLDEETILEKARESREKQVKRFCIVTSGRRVSKGDLLKIAGTVRRIRETGLLPCATLGLLDIDDLKLLKDSGLERYHHNIETSEKFFSRICSTHTYADKIRTIEAVKKAGLSLCSGGIFGMGETWQDRIDMAYALRELGADSIPVNYLTPVKGTPLGDMSLLDPIEALKIISIYRVILPDKEIRVCGGRLQTLGELNPLIFFAGADGLLVGNYLTTLGRGIEHDVNLIHMLGFNINDSSPIEFLKRIQGSKGART